MKKYIVVLCFALLLSACGNGQDQGDSSQEANPIASTPTPEPTPAETAPATEAPQEEAPPPQEEVPPEPEPEPTPKPKPVYQKLASYTSPMTSEDKNRIYNMKLAAKKLQEHVIDPGETMSFNKVVGDTNQPQGYKKAVIYVDGKKEEGYGGGVCQVSSTLYNPAMNAELEIVERHPHNGPAVHYVPAGKDAAVAYGHVDLKIKNVYKNPVVIYVSVDGDGVTVTLKKKV